MTPASLLFEVMMDSSGMTDLLSVMEARAKTHPKARICYYTSNPIQNADRVGEFSLTCNQKVEAHLKASAVTAEGASTTA